jgi:hypothetical protein
MYRRWHWTGDGLLLGEGRLGRGLALSGLLCSAAATLPAWLIL